MKCRALNQLGSKNLDQHLNKWQTLWIHSGGLVALIENEQISVIQISASLQLYHHNYSEICAQSDWENSWNNVWFKIVIQNVSYAHLPLITSLHIQKFSLVFVLAPKKKTNASQFLIIVRFIARIWIERIVVATFLLSHCTEMFSHDNIL